MANSPQDFSEILIGTVAEWAGIERAIAIITCVGHRETITPDTIHIALTRGQNYLILFGDYDFWWQVGSPLRSLLAQGIHTERNYFYKQNAFLCLLYLLTFSANDQTLLSTRFR